MFKQGKGAIVAPKAKGIEKTIKEVHDKKADLVMRPLYEVRYFARSLDLEEILLMQANNGVDCAPFIAEVISNSPLLRQGLDENLITKSNATSDIRYKIKDNDGKVVGESKSRIDGLSNILLNNLITVQVPKTGLGKIQLDGIIESGFVIEGIEYHVLTWTPGSSRRGSVIFAAIGEKEIQYLQNKIGGGVLLEEVKRKIGAKDAHKLLTKLGSRVGQFSSPGLFAGQIGWNQGTGFIVIDGKLQGPSDFNAGLKGLENDRELYDGQAMFLDELMQSVLNTAANGKLFSLGEARRCAVQIRTDKIYSKICADAYTRASFDALVNHIKNRYKYKIFGNSANIVAVFDTNAAKVINFDFLEKDINVDKNSMSLYLLAIAKEHSCRTSSQLLNKLGAFDKDATLSWIKNTKEEEVKEIINANAEGNGSMYDNEEKLYAPNAIWNIATRAYEGNKELYFNIAKCEPILNSLVGQTTKKINSDIANFRIKLKKASSLTVLFDPSYLLSDRKIDGILGVTGKGQIEVFCADRRGDAEASAMIGVKYPAPGLFDTERFQRVSLEQIEIRLKTLLGNGKITKEEYVAILEKFKYAAFGVVYMAPINFIKRKLAGMDTDFDAVSLIWEPVLVNIAEKGFEEEAKARGIKGPWSGPIPYIEYGTL